MSLRLDAVTRAFSRRSLFAPITLNLVAGEQATLTGPNGSGKTTLLRICAGLLQPTNGTVSAQHCAFVSQDAPMYPDLTSLEHVKFALGAHGAEGDAAEILADAGLAKVSSQPARVLSRGQRQRMHLAIAFASGAPLLLLDEPFTGLDADGETWLMTQLTSTKAAVLLAAHEPHHIQGTKLVLEHA
jgi:heme exporter protein A